MMIKEMTEITKRVGIIRRNSSCEKLDHPKIDRTAVMKRMSTRIIHEGGEKK